MKTLHSKKLFACLSGKQAFIPAVIAMFLFSIASAQDIYPSAIIQIKKADPDMIKKLSL